MLSATSRPGEGFWGLGDDLSCLGESGSPKRDDLVMIWYFACILAHARWEWVFGRTCGSPRREDLA